MIDFEIHNKPEALKFLNSGSVMLRLSKNPYRKTKRC
jgi:hypothetical protein